MRANKSNSSGADIKPPKASAFAVWSRHGLKLSPLTSYGPNSLPKFKTAMLTCGNR
jgi:hypothetical protein